MKLEYLKEFITVAELQSFTKASERLYMTPSALTRHMMQLENELGVNLMDRDTHSFALTDCGREAYGTFYKMLTDFEDLEKKMYLYTNGMDGTLKIGMLYYAIDKYIIPVTSRLSSDYPRLHLDFFSGQPHQVAQALRNRTVDVGLLHSFRDDAEFAFHKIIDIRMVALHAKSHPFARRDKVSLNDLYNETIVLFTEDDYSNETTLNALKKCGFTPQNITYTNNIDAIPLMLDQSGAVHITAEDLSHTFANLQATPIDAENLKVQVGFVYRKDNNNPAVPLFLRVLGLCHDPA